MYRVKTIEKALIFCGFSISEFFIRNGFVRKVEGKVKDQEVVWDATGHCFTRIGNSPLPQYNLQLSNKYIDVDARGIASIHNLHREDLDFLLKVYDGDFFGEKIKAVVKRVNTKSNGKLSAIRH